MLLARLGTSFTSPNYLKLEQAEAHDVGLDSQGYWRYLSHPTVTLLNGKDAGPVAEADELRAIGHYLLSFGSYTIQKHVIIIEVNPIIYRYGQVSHPNTLLQGESGELTMVLSNFKQVPLGELPWIMKVGISRV